MPGNTNGTSLPELYYRTPALKDLPLSVAQQGERSSSVLFSKSSFLRLVNALRHSINKALGPIKLSPSVFSTEPNSKGLFFLFASFSS